jgi:hypothetical protein
MLGESFGMRRTFSKRVYFGRLGMEHISEYGGINGFLLHKHT